MALSRCRRPVLRSCKSKRRTSALLDAPRPGGYIVEREHFVAEHAPLQESSSGTVILEARRHLLDFAEMTPAELAELGPILNKLVPAIKAATGVQRVYYLAYLAQQPPLSTSFSEAEAMSDKIREQFSQS